MDRKESGFFLEPGSGSMTRDLCAENVYTDISEEYTLPEYEPEIRRILRVTARVLPAGRYVGASRAEFAGSVVYSLLYCGAENEVSEVSLSSDYEFSVPLGDTAEREVRVFADTEPESVVCRPGGPRRVMFRTRLKSRVRILCDMAVPTCECPEGGAERLLTPATASRILPATSGEFEVEGAIRLDGGTPMCCDGTLYVSEVRPQNGIAVCRGELWVRVLTKGEDGRLYGAAKRIPVEREIDVDGLTPEWSCRAKGYCYSCEASAGNGNGSEEGSVSAVCEIELECAHNISVQLCSDAYLTDAKSECETERVQLSPCVVCRSFNLTVSGSRPAAPEESGAETAFAVAGDVSLDSPELTGGKAVFRGTLSLAGVLVSDGGDGEQRLSPLRMELPFKAETDAAYIPADGAQPHGAWSGTLVSARVGTEGERVTADAEIALTARVTADTAKQTVCRITASPAEEADSEKRGAATVIYYPDGGESVWSVAKKYRVPARYLAEANNADRVSLDRIGIPESLDGISFLIIPDAK